MENQNWNQIGNEIKDAVQKAIATQDFSQLNETVSSTVRSAMEQVSQGLQNAASSMNERPGNGEYVDPDPAERAKRRSRDKGVALDARETADGERIRFTDRWVNQPMASREVRGPFAGTAARRSKAYLQAIAGGILTAGFGVGLLATLITALVSHSANVSVTSIVVTGLFFAGSVWLFYRGLNNVGRLERFRNYVRLLKGRSYYELEELSKQCGKKLGFVRKDIKQMVASGLFLEGHLDEKETCLMVTNEAYDQYRTAQKEYEERKRREALFPKNDKGLPPEVESILKEGHDYLDRIHICNDRIPGEEISRKISRMEFLVQRIFERVKEQPEAAGDLKKMMNYYLPTTVKLLDAYADMDSQPVQGENITSAKKEIEDTLDTLNLAFEKLLDEIFKDMAWDVSTDISVLHTLLAQEGLTGTAFDK
ncbi:MAG: 5-bromo-4-chloroindolyl phosphate hydrolysis family protein [Blautia sp.]